VVDAKLGFVPLHIKLPKRVEKTNLGGRDEAILVLVEDLEGFLQLLLGVGVLFTKISREY